MSSNFKYHLVSLLLWICIAANQAAFAKAPISSVSSDSIHERINQLERISNVHSQFLTQLQQHLSDNENDIDFLRGQIQENQYQLNQIVERQKKTLQKINEFTITDKDAQFSSEIPNQTSAMSAVSENTGERITNISSNDIYTDYKIAIALMQNKSRQNAAITKLQNFIKKYPNTAYHPNAYYWLGQLNYNKGNIDDALFYFSMVGKNYPVSAKAPDAMLKAGMISQVKRDTAKAKAVYKQVIEKYPGTNSAKQAQKRLNLIK